MKGNWDGFSIDISGSIDKGDSCGERPVNGTDYNTAGSGSVGQVDSITTVSNSHSIPQKGAPNSVIKNYRDGKLNTERYFDSDGKPYLDIDYSNHGNTKMHPHVPHEHKISFKDGKMIRTKTDGEIE